MKEDSENNSNGLLKAIALVALTNKVLKGKAKDSEIENMPKNIVGKATLINDAVHLVSEVKKFLK